MKLCLILFLLLIPIGGFAQSIPHTETGAIKVEHLDQAVADDTKTSWLDLARLLFPDVQADSGSFSRSLPIRRLRAELKPEQLNVKMRIAAVEAVWFLSEGKERLAILFQLQPGEQLDSEKLRFYALAVYAVTPGPILLDAVDAQMEGLKADKAKFYGYTEVEVGKGQETIWLVNTEQTSATNSTENNRFLLLDGGRLRIVAASPTLVNSTDCQRISSQTFHTDMRRQLSSTFPDYQFTVSTEIEQNNKCSHAKWAVNELRDERYHERWDPAKRVFDEHPIGITRDIASYAYGSIADERTPYHGSLEFPRAYTTEGVYDKRRGLRLLHAPPGIPGQVQIKVVFEDMKGLLPRGNIPRPMRRTIVLQVISEKTKLLPNKQKRVTIFCVLFAFGKRAWWNTPG